MTVVPTLDFDFTFNQVDVFGITTLVRRFTTNGTLMNGIYQQTPIIFSQDLQQPIIMPRYGPIQGSGRCGYQATRFVQGITNNSGWVGSVITIPVGMDPTLFNVQQFGQQWRGRAINSQGGGSNPVGTIWYSLIPFTTQGFGQPVDPLYGTYAFEAEIACGEIIAGVTALIPSSGCPMSLAYGPGEYDHSQNYYRGRIRKGQYGQFSPAEPGWPSPPTLQQVLNRRAGQPQNPFSVQVA